MRQPRLYIGYSRADRSTAHKLADYLHRAYDEVWLDEHRYGGEVWWHELLWNLKACDIFIYLLSPMSVEAAYCLAEFAEARRLRKQILPVLIQRGTPIPSDLEPFPVFDVTGGLNTSKVGELLAALKQLEARFPEAPQPPLDPAPTPIPQVIDAVPPPRTLPRWLLPILGLLVVIIIGAVVVFRQNDPLFSAVTPTETPTVTPVATITLSPSATRTILPPSNTPSATGTRTPTLTVTSTLTLTTTPTITMTPTETVTPSATIPPQTSTSTVPPTVTRRAKVARSTATPKE